MNDNIMEIPRQNNQILSVTQNILIILELWSYSIGIRFLSNRKNLIIAKLASTPTKMNRIPVTSWKNKLSLLCAEISLMKKAVIREILTPANNQIYSFLCQVPLIASSDKLELITLI